MRVILLQKIPGIGEAGEVREVKPGFAQNFLFPRRLARLATSDAIAGLEADRAAATRRAEKDLRETEKLAIKLQRTPIEISMKSAAGGKLYGSVTPVMVAQTLKAKGFAIPKERVRMAHPLKEVGDYKVMIELPHGLEAEVEITITASAPKPA